MKNIYKAAMAIMLLSTTMWSSAQSPAFSSYPAAPAVIFLDFDGHFLTGSSWNSGGPLVLGPSNLNNTQVLEIFNRISEDYRPFNINITTDSAKYWSAPATRRMRVVFTITSDWYGSAGGIAYMGSFRWGDNTPCFVFTALLNYNVKNIAEAAAHEAGHTLGLRHQAAYNSGCVKTSEYNSGTGNGEISWAPIMGVGYYRNWTVWHNGPNTYGCNSTQSDLDIITGSTNGFGYRTDDHPDDAASATSITFDNSSFNVSGIIERTDDRDLFKLVMNKRAQLKLQAIPYNVGTGNVGSDLDMQVQLENETNQVLNTYNPGTALSSFLDTVLEAGTYFLRIDGKGNLYASEYGSLGSYSIEGTIINISPLPLRRLELYGSADNNRHKLDWVIDADEKVVLQTVEVSANGRDFRVLYQSSPVARTYLYAPSQNASQFYRLKVFFDNGQYYYSNVVTLRNAVSVSQPSIVGNVIGSTLMVNSPVSCSYEIADLNGRLIVKGLLRTGMNHIDMSRQARGMYLVQFRNGNEHTVERFVKQ